MSAASLSGGAAATGAPGLLLSTVERPLHATCRGERWVDHYYLDRAVWQCICGTRWEVAA